MANNNANECGCAVIFLLGAFCVYAGVCTDDTNREENSVLCYGFPLVGSAIGVLGICAMGVACVGSLLKSAGYYKPSAAEAILLGPNSKKKGNKGEENKENENIFLASNNV